MEQKIKSETEIEEIAEKLKSQNKKIVTYNGSFDILHIGHVQSLQEAKKQGDILIVLLNSDTSIKLYKSSKRPIILQQDRAAMLTALSCVDYVVIFDEINPKKILERIKPAVHCNGSDWGESCIEAEVVKNNGGLVHLLKWIPGYSTTHLIEKIRKAYNTPLVKAIFIDRDGTINKDKEGYIHTKEEFEFNDGVVEGLKKLSDLDYKIIIITNQSGIKKGLYSEGDLLNLHQWLKKELNNHGVRLDSIYYCPHDDIDNCLCRKPKIGMLLKAVKDFDISLNDSWLIGDDVRDIQCGREANVKTIKLGEKITSSNVQPNHYAQNFLEAVRIINSSVKE